MFKINKLWGINEYHLYCGERLSRICPRFENSLKCLCLISFFNDMLMQIWKSLYMFEFIKSDIPKIFTFNLLQLLSRFPLNFAFFLTSKAIFNISNYFCIFVKSNFISPVSLAKKVLLLDIFSILLLLWKDKDINRFSYLYLCIFKLSFS